MVSTFQAVGVFLLALLPGALYAWGFESRVGQWGITRADRLARFVGGSAVFHALFAPLSYWIWDRYLRTGRLAHGRGVPLYLWPIAIGYVLVPFLAGTTSGLLLRAKTPWRRRLSRWVNGSHPAPRAWDHLFASGTDGWIRLKLKGGGWIGGLYVNVKTGPGTRNSYASGYPYDQELYILRAADLDPQTGAFLRDAAGQVPLRPSGILVRWSEVEYLDLEEF